MAIMNQAQIVSRFNNHAPKKLKDFLIYNARGNGSEKFDPFTESLFNGLWNDRNEYENALISFLCEEQNIKIYPFDELSDYSNLFIKIYNDFGERYIYDDFYEYIIGWDNTLAEYNSIFDHMNNNILKCVVENRYKWGNLMKSTLLDFNPLWNVDGVTGEVRETTHTGTDTTSHDGTDTTTKGGDDSTTRTGNEELEYMGSKYNDKSGKETTTNSGTDTNTISKTTTESDTWYNTEKNALSNGKQTTLVYEGVDSGSQYRDTESFNQRKDKRTYNSLKDKIDYNSTSELEYNSSLERLLNLKDKDLFMQIRQGNIGVTETTTLLNHFREYVNYNIMNIVAKDITNDLTKGVY